MTVRVLHGDCRDLLPTLPAESVQCVVTSPPYWGLRDYGVDGQLGLEATPEAYLEQMVGVFRAVRRVLRADGTLWCNMGDCYNTSPPGNRPNTTALSSGLPNSIENQEMRRAAQAQIDRTKATGLKPKDLVGMPWRLAFALQADGWYLRADIIWAKPNPMPESVTDRPTKAHEYVFLLTKSARYFYDADAVREPAEYGRRSAFRSTGYENGRAFHNHQTVAPVTNGGADPDAGRNLRSVWTLPTEPTPEAHFATFPSALASRCIQAGTSEKGCCAACGAPWARQVERTGATVERAAYAAATAGAVARHRGLPDRAGGFYGARTDTSGWTPACPCAAPVVPCTVLDPFAGSGTVGAVAEQRGRHSILIELSPAYVEIATARTAQRGLFAQ